MKIKGAIFDMDGTVIDSLMFWDCLWQRIGERYLSDPDFRPSDEINKRVRTMIYSDAMAYFHQCYEPPIETAEFVKFASDGLRDFYRDTATVKTGAMELLAHLKSRGIPICLASATAMSEVKLTLECHGLLQYFDCVLSCADIGAGKDKPDIYRMACDRMGLSPTDVCVVEDSHVALETAKGIGCKTVGVYDRYSPGQERLAELADIYLREEQNLAELIGLIQV